MKYINAHLYADNINIPTIPDSYDILLIMADFSKKYISLQGGSSLTLSGLSGYGINVNDIIELHIVNNVTSINNEAFKDFSIITKVVIGNSVTSIGNNSFQNCTAMHSLTIGDRVSLYQIASRVLAMVHSQIALHYSL